MNANRPFFDTNILIYAFATSDPRADIADKLLKPGGTISVQCLNEFVNVCRRKYKMSWTATIDALAQLQAVFPHPLPLTAETHQAALQIAQRYGYAIYDSLLIASALQANCTVLYSEDMHSSQVIEGLQIQNPFSALPPQ